MAWKQKKDKISVVLSFKVMLIKKLECNYDILSSSTGSNMLYGKKTGWENTSSLLCCSLCIAACVNPQTEKEKIGHFHIYLSVRSRAVCRERGRGRRGGRRAATTGILRFHKSFSFLSLNAQREWGVRTYLPAWTQGRSKQRQGEMGKERK